MTTTFHAMRGEPIAIAAAARATVATVLTIGLFAACPFFQSSIDVSEATIVPENRAIAGWSDRVRPHAASNKSAIEMDKAALGLSPYLGRDQAFASTRGSLGDNRIGTNVASRPESASIARSWESGRAGDREDFALVAEPNDDRVVRSLSRGEPRLAETGDASDAGDVLANDTLSRHVAAGRPWPATASATQPTGEERR